MLTAAFDYSDEDLVAAARAFPKRIAAVAHALGARDAGKEVVR
jgi:hypothetical protein